MHPIEPLALLGNRGRGSRRTNRRPFEQRRHIGVPKLMLARLRDGLRLGKVRNAVRDGIGDARDHIAHEDIRNHAAKQKGIAVAHVIGKRASTRQQSFRLSDMNIPTWHSHPRKTRITIPFTASHARGRSPTTQQLFRSAAFGSIRCHGCRGHVVISIDIDGAGTQASHQILMMRAHQDRLTGSNIGQ